MAEKIVQRIDSVLKLIKRVQDELNGCSYEEFSKQTLLCEAVSFSVSQVGERMNRLEELIGHKYPSLPWKEARKMRNIIVHDYDNVDFYKVYMTAMVDLPTLKEELLKVKNDIKQIYKYIIKLDRLYLRPWDDFDADELFELAKDPEIGYWCGWEPHKHIRDSFFALHNFLQLDENYAICLQDNRIIGSAGLQLNGYSDLLKSDDECELGYWIGKPFWNKGYATEVIKSLIKRAFISLNMSTIWCRFYKGNDKSKHILEKLSFRFCQSIDGTETTHGKTIIIMCLTKDNWNQ